MDLAQQFEDANDVDAADNDEEFIDIQALVQQAGRSRQISESDLQAILATADEEQLREAWSLASRIRSAIVLASGRTSGGRYNVLPHERGEIRTVSRLLGYEPGQGGVFEEDYLRAARRARAVTERVFYG